MRDITTLAGKEYPVWCFLKAFLFCCGATHSSGSFDLNNSLENTKKVYYHLLHIDLNEL